MTQTKMEQTLKALYNFIASNYEDLKQDWNKLPKQDKSRMPLPLFCIVVFADLVDNLQGELKQEINTQNKDNAELIQETQVENNA